MNARITLIFYIVLGLLGVMLVLALDANQNQPAPTPNQSTQGTIELNLDDFNGESENLQEAVQNLSKPVQKPGSDQTLNQLQPAAQNSDAHYTPQ